MQVAISRVRISVLREELKEKSSRHLCSLKLMMCFLIGPGRTDMCSFYIYTSQYLREFVFHIKVLSVFFGEIPMTANNSFNLYRYLFFNTKCAVRVQVLCCAFTEKRAIDLFTNYNTLQIKNDTTTLKCKTLVLKTTAW